MYFIEKESSSDNYSLCELNVSEGVYVPNIAYGKTLEDLQKECDLIFGENVINITSLKVMMFKL